MAQFERDKLKDRIHEVIFEAETREGKWFDIILLISILMSVFIVILETVPSVNVKYGKTFHILEWVFTIFFTIEYILRIYSVYKPRKYIFSFYGIIDLVSIIPTYLSIFIAGSQQLLVIRAFRLMRVFRIFKLGSFLHQARTIMLAMQKSIPKILVFLSFVLVLVIIIGSIMHLLEAGVNPSFDSIPRSIYWAIVTLTTVGYGDITPVTTVGQFLSAIVMLLGYSIIAVPTGIVSSELVLNESSSHKQTTEHCPHCSADGHDYDAMFCKFCGEPLNSNLGI
jgi:voltage-gated potassium channel